MNMRILAFACQMLLGAFWLWAGVAKIVGHAAFAAVLEGHGSLNAGGIAVALTIPYVEALLGIAWIATTRTKTKKWLCAASVCLLLMFVAYILTVPQAQLSKFGCGCGAPLTQQNGPNVMWYVLWNSCIAAIHVLAVALLAR